jgi:hypothetical protein
LGFATRAPQGQLNTVSWFVILEVDDVLSLDTLACEVHESEVQLDGSGARKLEVLIIYRIIIVVYGASYTSVA